MTLPLYVPLPPKRARLGPVEASWEELDPGVALIRVQGGTTDDRALVFNLLRVELAHHGIEHAQFRLGAPVDEGYWEDEATGPEGVPLDRWRGDGSPGRWESLYHGTSEANHADIMRDGIVPWNHLPHPGHNWTEDEGSQTEHWYEPRVDHVYLTRDRGFAQRIAPASTHGHKVVYEVDPAYLDPQHINPDEDSGESLRDDWPMPDDYSHDWHSRGEWAEAVGLGDDTDETRRALNNSDALAYRETIPPQAIRAIHYYGSGVWDREPNPAYRPANARTAGWSDIEAKAKRLVQSGNVTILRNSRNTVVAHVIGDHGEYNCEFSRDDPESWALTQWHCECPWNQYAFQRTRRWKKFEARPCAHVLATFWSSRRHHLDEELTPGDTIPRGHKGFPGQDPGGQGVQQQLFAPGDPGQFTQPTPPPEPAPQPVGPPVPPPGDIGAPPANDIIPEQPMLPGMALPLPVPGSTPSGMPSPPNAVSVPGAKIPTPFAPVQYPGGTFSKVAAIDHSPGIWGRGLVYKGEVHTWPEWMGTHGDYVQNTLGLSPLHPEARMIERFTITPEGTLGQKQLSPGNHALVQKSLGLITAHLKLAGQAKFENGMKVKLLEAQYGIAEGKSEAHGSGQYREVPAGSHGEVLSQDELTKWVEVIVPLGSSGPLEPYHVRMFLAPKDIQIIAYPPGSPFVKRIGPHT